MLDTNTISFLSKDSLSQMDSVQSEVLAITHHLANSPLPENNYLIGELVYAIIFIIAFAFIRLRGKNLFLNLLNVVFKRKKVETILNEGISSNLFNYILSLSLSFSVISGCISTLFCDFFLSIYTLYTFTALLIYHFTLLFLIRLLGWTFNSQNTAAETTINLWTYHIIIGLAVSPFVLSSFFVQHFAVESLLQITTFSLAFLLLVKFARLIEILFIHRVSILYMILYLCAFEIMPLLIVYKIVV